MGRMEYPTPPHSGLHAPPAFREKPYRPTTPIKIPTRQRSILSPTFSPVNRPMSPDLIFEMSPINLSSTDSFPTAVPVPHYSPFLQRSLKNKKAPVSAPKSPPFMYLFPKTSTQNCSAKADLLAPPRSPQSPLHCSSTLPKISTFDNSPLQHHCLTSAFEDDFDNSYDSRDHSFVSRGRARRTSVSDQSFGLPSSGLASPISIHPITQDRCVFSQTLSPPLTAKSDQDNDAISCLEEENRTAVETDAHINWFDIGFGKHLMRRTHEEKRVRVGRTRAVESLRVTIGT